MTTKPFLQPLDRTAIALMLILSLLIGLLILQGDVVASRVRDFSWQNQQIGADDISFSVTFSRPMDIKSVEDNLKIDPPLAGKFSWAGRRMVYTLLTPAPYGTNYKVQLQGAKDRFAEQEKTKRLIQPFTSQFRTRDRVILYIGADQQEQGQLVLYNLSSEQKKVLTPKDLVVMDFEPFPNGEKILFSARAANNQDLLSAQLYTVTTGIPLKADTPTEPAGKIDLILDNKDYQNLKFDLSPDGQTIVIQRGNKNNPGDFGLWFMPTNNSGERPTPQRLKSQPGGDFMITPDSKAVAVAQGQGAAILPLQNDATKPLDFLPQFGLVQAFSKDGSKAAMVRFNTDFTKELFLVTNQGTQQSLSKTTGSILSCQFDPALPVLYCLLTQVVSKEQYIEQPYLVAIDLKTGQQKPLLVLPIEQRNVQMSLSPDGLGLLFDQVVPQTDPNPSATKTLKTDDGEAIATSNLWLMPLLPISDTAISTIRPDKLPFIGFHPRWLP
ncbi:Ig-like domain-containing protein [Nostoc sp. MS1]|uniref:Ig-like domain-containing protein n=1 Tax=Nostoc sp. MS1 TaxID=2764711 RepID=UPI001CC4B9AB|nr:Ig-like domain-containing protein [Nostoc sp. MS1]